MKPQKDLKIKISEKKNQDDINFEFLSTPFIEKKAIYDIKTYINELENNSDISKK